MKKKLLILFILPIFFISCGGNILPKPKPLIQDQNLQIVKNIKAISDSTSVAFEWEKSNFSDLAGYRIYRAKVIGDVSEELVLVAVIEEHVATHYVDKELLANTIYKYAFTTFTADGRESKSSETLQIKTRPLISAPLYIHSVKDLANKTKLLWRPHPQENVSGYIIERQDTNTGEWETVGELNHRFEVEFIDRELETNKIYKYRVFSKTFDGMISEPSETVDAITKARPKTVSELRATTDLPREIRISWKSEADLKYRIYKSDSLDGNFKFVGETAKNSFSDKVEEDGVQKFYKVSTVDSTNLESSLPDLPVSGITLFPPKAPKIMGISQKGVGIEISWEATDNRSLKYIIERSSGSSWSGGESVKFESTDTTFTDSNPPKNTKLTYRISAIDEHGLISKFSEEKEFSIK
ncbi:fibronectin type 3 domain-containing protein [Thiovulum sp. ES]|nr:fibronectin type 3 domain-containing protein [Thiovulum sp. ES]